LPLINQAKAKHRSEPWTTTKNQQHSELQEKQEKPEVGAPQAQASDQNLEARWSARVHENDHDPEASHGANDHRQNQHRREADAEAKHGGHGGGAEPETKNEKKPETDHAAGQHQRAHA
jgi:hypothetical protein